MTEYWNDPNELADHLDEVLPPGRKDTYPTGADDPLTRAASALANDPPPALSFEAMARIQAQMLNAHAEQQQATAKPAAPSRTRRILRMTQGVMTVAASMIIVLFFVTPLISESVPGDALYPVKRSLEQVQLQTAGVFGTDEAALRLELAENRVREAMVLVNEGEFNRELVESSVNELMAAAEAVERNADGSVPMQLVGQTVQVNALLDYVLAKANLYDDIPQIELVAASEQVTNARNSGQLLLPSSISPPDNEAISPTPESVTVPAPVVGTSLPPPDPLAELTADPEPSDTPPPTEPQAPTETPAPELIAETTPESTPEIILEYGVIVASGVVNVRSGPGTDFEIIAALRPNMQVVILGENDDASWVNVLLPDEREGWIAEFLISDEPVTGTQPTCNGASCDPVGNPADPADPAPGDNGGNGNDNPGDFGCDQPGNACNAPGQPGDTGQPENPGNSGNNPPGNGGGNPGGGNPGGGRP